LGLGGYLVIFRGVWVWTGEEPKRNKEERGEEEFRPKEGLEKEV